MLGSECVVMNLQLVKDFYKKIPENVHEIHVKDRFGNNLMISTLEDTLRDFGHYKVLNFFDPENGTFDVYVEK